MSEQLSDVDALAQLTFVVQGVLEARAAERDLSLVQTRLLGVLRDRTPTMNELATLLGLDKSSVTGLVDRAQRRGLVGRRASTADRRATHVHLTRPGRRSVDAVAQAFAGDVRDLLSPLPAAERRALTALVSRLLVVHAERHGLDLFPNS